MRTPAAADRDRITTLRLAAQRIGASEPATPAEVVARMLAMQGQDAPGVRWSVGLRAGGLTETDVVAALAAGELVRSWPLRGTLHLVLAADLRWLLALTGERLLAATAKRRAALDITGDDTRNARAATERALAGRQSLARPAFLAMLAEAGVAVDAQRGYHLIFWLALSGVIVLVGTGDGQPAIGLADEWLPKTPDRDRDDALTDLARRFVTSHGPATDADLARWTGLPLGQVRRGLAGAGTAIERIDIGGTGYWVGAGAAGEAAAGESVVDEAAAGEAAGGESVAAAAPRVHLMPGFDEYVLGYVDRTVVIDADRAEAIVPGNNGMFKATVVAGGRVVGTWARIVNRREVIVEVTWLDGAPPVDDATLAAAAARYGAYIGLPSRVRIAGV